MILSKFDQEIIENISGHAVQNNQLFVAALGNGASFKISKNTSKTSHVIDHAEINVLREHLQYFKDIDSLTLYTTCEPCPMCMSAIIWSGIKRVIYCITIPQLAKGHNQIAISTEEVAAKSWYQPEIIQVKPSDGILSLL